MSAWLGETKRESVRIGPSEIPYRTLVIDRDGVVPLTKAFILRVDSAEVRRVTEYSKLAEEKFRSMTWLYVDDPANTKALETMRGMLEDAGRRGEVVPYSDLGRNMEVTVQKHSRGRPFRLDFSNYEFHSAVIGHFLGFASAQSYLSHRFMVSVLAGGKNDGMPTRGFFKLALDVGLIPSLGLEHEIPFLNEQREHAYSFFRGNGVS
jgi:hypothetical protein